MGGETEARGLNMTRCNVFSGSRKYSWKSEIPSSLSQYKCWGWLNQDLLLFSQEVWPFAKRAPLKTASKPN